MNLLIPAACLALLCACSFAKPPPPGFVDSCYGGDFQQRIEGKAASLVLQLVAPREQWPDLARAFEAFGAAHGLDFFDTSASTAEGPYMVNVHLCSAKGIWLFADSRMRANVARPAANEVPIYLVTFGDGVDTAGLTSELGKAFRDWPQVSAGEAKGGR